MKKILKITLLIVVTAISTFLIQKYWPIKKLSPTIEYGQLKEDNSMSLVKQTNEYSDFDGTYKFKILGTTWIRCSWKATSSFGIKIPKDWNWDLKYNDRTIIAKAPKIELLDVNVGATDCSNIKNGMLVDDQQFRNFKEKEFEKLSRKKALVMLNSNDLVVMAKLSLESRLFGILSQANPELGLLKVNVTFDE